MVGKSIRLLIAGSLLGLVAGTAAGQNEGTFEQSFAQRTLPGGWEIDASTGNSVTPSDGWLEIRADENTYAHVQRPLGREGVRAWCELQPGSGISWCTSLFLYWAPGDWCQIGVIPRGNGRYYACITTAGQRQEHDLTRCGFTQWHRVGIELGSGCLRFVSSTDGGSWRTELVVPRPSALTGPARLLIIGKGFGLDASTPDLDCDYGERGKPTISKVRHVCVEPLPPERMAITPQEVRAQQQALRDPWGTEVLARAGDPDYERVAAVFPALRRPREAVGVPDHRYEVGVAHDGTIQLAGEADGWEQHGDTAWFEVGDPAVRFGTGGCRKSLSDGYLPTVRCRWDYDGLQFEQTVFAMSDRFSPDEELAAYIRVRITNTGAGQRSVPIAFCWKTGAGVPTRSERIASFDGGGGFTDLAFRVASPLRGRSPQGIPAGEAFVKQRESEDWWAARLNAGMTIRTPEPRINDAYRAWLAYNSLNVDRKDSRFDVHDGSGFYEAVFGYSAALACHALDLWGRHDESRRNLESLLSLVRPDGLLFENYGLPDMGATLLAVVEHYRLTGDEQWARRQAPTLTRMCDWIIRKRDESKSLNADGSRPLTYGLIRFTPYADYPEHTFDYYGDGYSCTGIERTAHLFDEIGLAEEADRLAREAAAYRADILASMDAAVIEREGLRLLPMEPDTHRLLRASGYRTGDYYGLVASMFLESEFLHPTDPRARIVVDALEQRGGLILGMCEFNEGVDHAYTYGYWLNSLHRGEIERVVLGLYGSLAYGMGQGTYCGVEVTQLTTGDPTPTMPHTYSGTQQLRLLRMMLVLEEGQELILARATPDSWLTSGNTIEVRDAPTRFGTVEYRLESRIEQNRVVATIQPPTRNPPKLIRLFVRVPESRAIRSATVNGEPAARIAADHIVLEPGTGPLIVDVRF